MLAKIPLNFTRKFAFQHNCGVSKCHASCWNCHKNFGKKHKNPFFCESCHKIQEPSCDNFFQLFDQPKKFEIDTNKLDKTYQSFQRKVHPDRFYSKSDQEKELSMKASGCINEGYYTLKDPLSRGEYILHLYKEKPLSDVPQEFLIDVLEIHEEIDEAETVEQMVSLINKVQAMINDYIEELGGYLTIEDDKLKDAKAASETLSKLKYLSRIRDKIKSKMPVQKNVKV